METDLEGGGPRAELGREASGSGRPLLPKEDKGTRHLTDGDSGPGPSPVPSRKTDAYVCHVCRSHFPDEDTMWLHMIQAYIHATQPAHVQVPPPVLGPLGEMLALQLVGLTQVASSNVQDEVNVKALSKLAQLTALAGGIVWMPPGWCSGQAMPGVLGAGLLLPVAAEHPEPYTGLAGLGPFAQLPLPIPIRSTMPATSPHALISIGANEGSEGKFKGPVAGVGGMQMDRPGMDFNKRVAVNGTRDRIPVHAAGLQRKARRFACPACPRNYASRSGLWMHTRSVHHGRRHICVNCQREFPFQSGLITHACVRAPLEAVANVGAPKRGRAPDQSGGSNTVGRARGDRVGATSS